ncbi:MAG: flippase-like domain-containing protein [Neisseriaceae bacterium]|nr:flippase-like domain-containing protein [Neisseriaceae bacterium]
MNKILTEKHLRALIISVLFAVIGYFIFVLLSGWQDVLNAVTRIGLMGIVIALCLSLVNYGLRFIRWQMYLNTMGYNIPFSGSLKIYLSGFALTTTPGKAGEALRGVLLKPLGVPWKICFAALLSERLSDLLAIVLLTLFGLSVFPNARLVVVFSLIFIAVILLILFNKRLLEHYYSNINENTRIKRMIKNILGILLEARRCQTPRLFIITLLLSVIAWGAEAYAFYLMLKLMGFEFTLSLAIFIYAFSTLAGSLSFLPGGLGGIEAVMFGLLIFYQMPHADATAMTVVLRLVTLWFAVIIGLMALMRIDWKGLNLKGNE